MAHPTDPATGVQVHRGEVLHFLSDPGADAPDGSFEHFPDGVLIVRDGRIDAAGPAEPLLAKLPTDMPVTTYPDCILMPGFIDTHIHYPQLDVIASGGRELLDWLRDYTFPEEGRFADFAHASAVAEVFLDELMRNGTTTALVFCTVHSPSVEAFFQSAQRRNLRMIAGKVLMDRNCPDYLAEAAADGERATRELIERWHGRERLSYAITPRFAPTSSDEQLASAGRLAREYPNTYIHSHLAENRNEIAWVSELFPQDRKSTRLNSSHLGSS